MAMVLLCTTAVIEAFATHFTSDYCDRAMEEGVLVMGKKIEWSSERNLKIFHVDRPEVIVLNGSIVRSSDRLAVKMEPRSFQVVFEIRGDFKFAGGSCESKKRTNTDKAVIEMEIGSFDEREISIYAAWAKTYSGGVKLAAPMLLRVVNDESSIKSSDL